MAYGTHPHERYSYGTVSAPNRDRFHRVLGTATTVTTTEPGVDGGRPALRAAARRELADMGRAVRDDLEAPLDEGLLSAELATLADTIAAVPALAEAGIPDHGETPYGDLTPAAWRINEHLLETGFYEAAERHLPAFTDDHIATVIGQFMGTESPRTVLSDLEFTDEEQFALLTNVVTARDQLSWWQPSDAYPPVTDEDGYDEGVVHETVAPLHHRALEGSLLWIDGLDWWIWQHEVLITQPMLERAVWDVRSMLAGAAVLAETACGLAGETISDEDLTAGITAGTAIMLIGQSFLASDIAWIDDDMRKPRAAATTEGADR